MDEEQKLYLESLLLRFQTEMTKEVESNSHKGDIRDWIFLDMRTVTFKILYCMSKMTQAFKECNKDQYLEYLADMGNSLLMARAIADHLEQLNLASN